MRGFLGQGTGKERIQAGRQVRPPACDRQFKLMDHGVGQGGHILAVKRPGPGECLIENHGQRKQIAALIQVPAADLLR